MWSQFVESKDDFIGRTLESHDMGMVETTIIENIELIPNGESSAMFYIAGKDFDCSFDVKHGGITAGEKGWLTFDQSFGMMCRIKDEPK